MVCALLAATLGGTTHAAVAAPAATEEYVLELPGVETNRTGPAEPIVERARRAGPVGVVGESEPAPSTLAAVGSTAREPAGIALLVTLAAAGGLVARGRRGAG